MKKDNKVEQKKASPKILLECLSLAIQNNPGSSPKKVTVDAEEFLRWITSKGDNLS